MSLNFSRYDSSVFPTIPEGIAHSVTNPLLIENLSNYIDAIFEDEVVHIQEPSCLFKDMINFFEEDIDTIDLPKHEHYKPELTVTK